LDLGENCLKVFLEGFVGGDEEGDTVFLDHTTEREQCFQIIS
jgi:hypothetical protein